MWHVPRTQLLNGMVSVRQVDELRAASAGEDVVDGRLVAIAAVMVVRLEDLAEWNFTFQFARVQVVAIQTHGPDAVSAALEPLRAKFGTPGPDKVIDDKDVFPFVPEMLQDTSWAGSRPSRPFLQRKRQTDLGWHEGCIPSATIMVPVQTFCLRLIRLRCDQPRLVGKPIANAGTVP